MVNLTSTNKNVNEIKQRIRVVKERFRATKQSLNFMSLPVILNINIVFKNVKLLGYFPTTDWI